jgi:peptidoglycan hydrolase-like protein with peptidoglycan-binding domain
VNKLAITAIASVGLVAIAAFPATAQLIPSNRYAQLQRTAAPADQLSMDVVPSLDEDNIRKVQQALEEKGFDVGPIDGIVGPKTREAVRSFQDRYGMKASGEIDNQTLFALGQVGLAGQP